MWDGIAEWQTVAAVAVAKVVVVVAAAVAVVGPDVALVAADAAAAAVAAGQVGHGYLNIDFDEGLQSDLRRM